MVQRLPAGIARLLHVVLTDRDGNGRLFVDDDEYLSGSLRCLRARGDNSERRRRQEGVPDGSQ